MARKLKSDKLLFTATLLLVCTGIVMVYSASAVMAMEKFQTPYLFLVKQIAWALMGLAVLPIVMRVDYRNYRQPAVIWSTLAIVGAALVAVLFGPRLNGATRWLGFAGLGVQPSELAKIAVIIFMAALLERRMDRIDDVSYSLLPIGVVLGLVIGLILAEPDLGTAACIVMIAAVMVFSAGISYRYVVGLVLAGVPIAYLLVATSEYRWRRVTAFLDPWADPLGDGWQMIQSMIAVGTGGVFGRGLMGGVQKLFYLPEPHNDFIYSVIGEELGLIGTTVVLACFCVIGWRGLRTAVRAPDRFGAFLAIGLTTMVGFQAFFNISVVLGLLPPKGIPLPFVSAGGSSLIINLIAMGILLNVSQQASSVARRHHGAAVPRCMKPLAVVIAGGGTGGHLYPGIAVARELLRRLPEAVVTFAGTARGIEARVVPREGFELDVLRSAALKGTSPAALARGLGLLPLSGVDAWRILSKRRPDIVLGVGGYSSGPVVLAAAMRGIPTMLLEQNAVPGLTNRLLAHVVSAAAVTFASTVSFFGRRAFVAGNPIRQEFVAAAERESRVRRRRRRRGAEGSDLWRLPGGARDQHGHGGGGAAAGRWTPGSYAPDRRARPGISSRRVPEGRTGCTRRTVPLRDGSGDELRRRRRLPRGSDDHRRADRGREGGGADSAADGGRRSPAQERGGAGARRGGGNDRAEGPVRRGDRRADRRARRRCGSARAHGHGGAGLRAARRRARDCRPRPGAGGS